MRQAPRRRLLGIIGGLLTAAACAGGAAGDTAPAGPPVFTGDLACADCAGIMTSLTLFPGDSFLLSEVYQDTPDGDKTYTSRGTYAFLSDAANPGAGRILLVSPNQGPMRRFRQLGDSALRQLDADMKEFESEHNMLLRRASPAADSARNAGSQP